MEKIVLSLLHDGKQWIAKNGEIVAKGETLDELDKEIESVVRKKYPGKKVKVSMEFDYSSIPFWIIQYHPYYLYRVIYI
ncbi:hypothetical protein Asulf_01028 [Archaeoglobus sulfaticallidus PM70-1]|uniref:DUF5678 domain-containing protein n=1 Tax=Archaeoglobus sulfaticallidus PM70-1 TaxID=387631 RepID=N0BFK7_9EURY|nr:DUF5395 family protein [Archaeoglobus sulfaticallidus]AGK61032.1 hypothetical protein Asulf_01028 [Archaeoglobus sulfaticallidus PM70-1]